MFNKIYNRYFEGHSQNGEILGDYCDGIFFKQHPLFSLEPHALQIILYFDDLELCNPLETSAKIHKIGKDGEKVCTEHTLLYVNCRGVLLSVGKPES